MLKSISAIAALLIATAFLYSGNGLQGTLLSVRADLEGFATPLIGILMSAYFVGFITGCRFVPGIIKSVGHIRTYVALASLASSAALAHSLFVEPAAWIGFRIITGFCFAGIAMVIESWINERVTNQNRGQILSIYRIVDLGSLTIGNALLSVASPAGFQLFALISILISLALVPVALTRTNPPKPITTARLDLKKLFALSPVGAMGALATGLGNASFWAMAPVYAQMAGYSPAIIGAFMSTVIIGAATSQWPLGWLSDKIDRRFVLVGTSILGVISCLLLANMGTLSQFWLFLIGPVFGAFIIPTFGLSIAHANDLADPDEAVATNGGLLLLHGSGAMFGATLGAIAMSVFGGPALFLYIATIYGVFAVLCLWRILQRKAGPDDTKGTFIPIPRSATPTVFEIVDPDEETK